MRYAPRRANSSRVAVTAVASVFAVTPAKMCQGIPRRPPAGDGRVQPGQPAVVGPAARLRWLVLESRLDRGTGGTDVRYFILDLAESHLTQRLFGPILGRIERLTWHPT